MTTRNKFGFKDWHIRFDLFHFTYMDDKYDKLFVFHVLPISFDESEGASFLSYARYGDPEIEPRYISVFYLNFISERIGKRWDLECVNSKYVNYLVHIFYNKWVCEAAEREEQS